MLIVNQNHGFVSVARMPKGTVIDGVKVGGEFVSPKHIGIFNAQLIVTEVIQKQKAVLFQQNRNG